MTVTNANGPGLTVVTHEPGTHPTVVSPTSPLTDGFHSRYFTADDYRRFHDRAPRYDAENSFFAEDFAEILGAGYLKAPLPKRLGGDGLSLNELAREQQHPGHCAPAH